MLKQMKLIYASGFSKTEKLEWKPVVFNNIVQSFRMIYDAMKEFDIPFEKPESEVSCWSRLRSNPFDRVSFYFLSSFAKDQRLTLFAIAERYGASSSRF